MANYTTLKEAIQQVVKTNGNNEITGALLQQSLLAMINSLGDGYQYKGVATPTTNPGTPDQNVFYIASESGTYSNFGGLAVSNGEVAIFKYNGTWTKEVTGAATAAQVTQLGQEADMKFDIISGELVFEQGMIQSNGANTSYQASKSVRTPSAKETTAKLLYVPVGYYITDVYYYSAWTSPETFTLAERFQPWPQTNQYTLDPSKGAYYRFVVKPSNSGDITPDELMEGLDVKTDINRIENTEIPALETRVEELEKSLAVKYTTSDLSVGNAVNNVVGNVVTYGTLTTYNYGVFDCLPGQIVKIYTTGGTGTARGLAFCDSDMKVLQTTGGGVVSGQFPAPANTAKVVVNCAVANLSTFSLEILGSIASDVETMKTEVAQMSNDIANNTYDSSALATGNANNQTVGAVVTIGSLTTFKYGIFDCLPGQIVNIYTTGGAGNARGLAFCDSDLKVLQTTPTGIISGIFTAPTNTAKVVVNCASTDVASFRINISGTIYGMIGENDYGIPQIFDRTIPRKTTSESIKILFFGSSWFVDTYWYLNKILADAGINATIKAFYKGGGSFSQWISAYNTPSSEDVMFSSVNGSDWVQSNENFGTILKEGGWDVIGFQQGALAAIDWDTYWKPYWSELLRIVVQNAEPTTIFAFNATWTPGLSGTLTPYEATISGQRAWQNDNNKNTKHFMQLSGIKNVSPNGATVWAMRRDASLNLSNDMATDGLHLDNGLPIYGICGTLYETYFAPMFGIPFKDIDWLPTSSTQKAPPSGQTWQEISAAQQAKIRDIVRLSTADRFGFNSL